MIVSEISHWILSGILVVNLKGLLLEIHLDITLIFLYAFLVKWF